MRASQLLAHNHLVLQKMQVTTQAQQVMLQLLAMRQHYSRRYQSNSDGIFGISNAGAITVADNTNLDYDTTNSYTLTIVASDASSSDVETVTIGVTDINDITPVYQAADADDAITVNENVGTGSIDAGTSTDADTVGTYGCTLGGADAADFACSISGSTVNVCFRSRS